MFFSEKQKQKNPKTPEKPPNKKTNKKPTKWVSKKVGGKTKEHTACKHLPRIVTLLQRPRLWTLTRRTLPVYIHTNVYWKSCHVVMHRRVTFTSTQGSVSSTRSTSLG